MEFNEIGQLTGGEAMGEKSRGNYAMPRKGMLKFKAVQELHKLKVIEQIDQKGLEELEDFVIVLIEESMI